MIFNKFRVKISIFSLHIFLGISPISIFSRIPEEKKTGLSISPCHNGLSKVSVKLYFLGTSISSSAGTVGSRGAFNVGLLGSMTHTDS